MAAKKTVELDFEFPRQEKKPKRPSKKFTKIFLIASAGVLVVALAVAAVLLLNKQQTVVRVMDFGTALEGVSVSGVDVSGMTRQEALEATASLEGALLSEVKVSLDVNGATHEFGASELGVTTDYIAVINKAMDYGHFGTFEERKAAADDAKANSKAFEITLETDETVLTSALANLKTVLDTAPRDASFQFFPWGYTLDADGTPTEYTFDMVKMTDTASRHKRLSYPDDIVRLSEDEKPLAIRYQYYNETKFEDKLYIPDAATISRFYYIPEQTGLDADTSAVVSDIMAQIESKSFSTITVPVSVTEPAFKLDDIKKQTQLITSWTSSYRKHDGLGRIWNVAKLSGIICGQIIEPGEQWSINDTAGPRDKNKGWKDASGILDGGFVDVPGGGVCQISSTLYNAAIRAGLPRDNVVSWHHSIRSAYMPNGMDATITSSGKDLKLTNPHEHPLYMVSFVNPETKTVTVQIYGPPLIDPDTGEEVIYDFRPGKAQFYGSPVMRDIYFKTQKPSGDPIPPGGSYKYSDMQRGMRVQTYRYFLRLDGTKYKEEKWEFVDVKPINGQMWWNVDPNASPVPSPVPSDTP